MLARYTFWTSGKGLLVVFGVLGLLIMSHADAKVSTPDTRKGYVRLEINGELRMPTLVYAYTGADKRTSMYV